MTTNEALDQLIHVADNFLREKNYSEALNFTEEAIRSDPKSTKAFLIKGLCENALGLTPKAINSFNEVLKLEPKNIDALLNIAIINIYAGDYDQAKELLGRVLDISSNSHGLAFECLGDIAHRRGQIDEAVESYERAINLAPSKDSLYFKKAMCHFKLCQFKEAFRNAEIAAELNPVHPEAKTLAEMAADQHLYEGAGFWEKLIGKMQHRRLKRQLKEEIALYENMKRINQKTEEQSIDPLMKIRNRSYFESHFQSMVETARKRSQPVAAIFFDLDHMKMFNENYGHNNLDKALAFIGEIFSKAVTENDMAARYGGDEFIIVLNNSNKERARTVLSSILSNIATMNKEKLPALGIDRPMTFSIGISSTHDDMEVSAESWADQLFCKADLAALYAKHHGRNQVVDYDLARKDEFVLVDQKAKEVAKEKAKKGERP